MKLHFTKYQGTGNDFIMIDDRNGVFPNNKDLIPSMCDRKMGIGADGLILIRNHNTLDFKMVYFNADGSQSMCGNGSRCAVNFADSLGLILSTDGPHHAFLTDDKEVELKLADVNNIEKYQDNDLFINTGSPHHIRFVDNVEDYNVYGKGKEIRENEQLYPQGTNVNFVEKTGDQQIFVRTFERGVEDETLSCGTGVTAASIAANTLDMPSPVQIKTLGGNLQVKFDRQETSKFTNIFLIGPAKEVFTGEIEI